MESQTRGYIMVIVGASLWGLSGTAAQDLFHSYGFQPVWLVEIRMLFSGILLLIIYRLLLPDNPAPRNMGWKDVLSMVIFGIAGLLAVQLAYFMTIDYSNAGTATLLQYVAPFFIMVWLVLHNHAYPCSLNANLLLCSSAYFGKLTDRIGSRIPATLGIAIMAAAIVVYLTLTIVSSLYVVLVGSFLTGTGSSMFYPANNSAVMANSPRELYGLSSGFLRTMANIGMLGSFVIAISIASISVPRYVAFEVFAGVLNSLGSVSASFMSGIHASLIVAIVILSIAAMLSLSRGGEVRSDKH